MLRMVNPKLFFSFLTFLTFTFSGTNAQDVAAGEKLFQANCVSCHAINEQVVGPALKDVHKKREEAWLINWIRNSQEMVKSGDEQAVAIYNEYNQSVMTSFTNLSDDEIKSVIAYIKTESEKPAATATTTASSGGTATASGVAASEGIYTNYTLIALVVMAVILLVIALVLVRIRSVVKELYRTKYPEEAEPPFYEHVFLPWVRTLNPTLVVMGFVSFFILIGGIYGFKYGLEEVGVQQGYEPTQPIAFPHDTHAGLYEIECQYCHSTAEKSKNASIPAGNTCMNCHSYVQAKDASGNISPEIQKLYDHMDFDPATKTYGDNPRPIKWIRIHNLPDLAYFNHSQHVKVGKQKCQTCHGEIQEMPVVAQHATLQMGWCVDCHRKTNVDAENNDYYEALHAKYKEEGVTDINVEMIGGLECSKCHY